MKGKIQTVLGLIEPDQTGFTLTHEHLLHELPQEVFKQSIPQTLSFIRDEPLKMENLGWVRQYPYFFSDNIEFSSKAVQDGVRDEMHFLKKCCGQATVVDNASVGLRARNHGQYLEDLSTETGITIVIGTGFYVAGSQTVSTLNMGREDMEKKIRDDILKGIDSSGVKCGVIGEVGCSWPLMPFEKKSLQASASVQQETGCPVILHPGRDKHSPYEMIRIFQEAGGNVDKTVMSHLDRTFLTGEELAEFASLGSYCELDLFGIEASLYMLNEDIDMPSDAQRMSHMLNLIKEGFGHKIVAAHDIHTKHRLSKFGGHGYYHLYVNVLPKMLKRGFSEEDINKIFYLNPRKWLTFE